MRAEISFILMYGLVRIEHYLSEIQFEHLRVLKHQNTNKIAFKVDQQCILLSKNSKFQYFLNIVMEHDLYFVL